MRRIPVSLFLILLATGWLSGLAQSIPDGFRMLDSGRATSIRAISPVSPRVIWVSGSQGWVGRSLDGGLHWSWHQVPGKGDYRCLKAFTAQRALIINAGSPATVRMTRDGGKSWRTVYRNRNASVFFDGMSFWNDRRGIALSDPEEGHFVLIWTRDGGRSWERVRGSIQPEADSGEACFAASNSALLTGPGSAIWIATGGTRSRVLHSRDGGRTWQSVDCPVLHGLSSTGLFSIACREGRCVAVGGDYQAAAVRLGNACLSPDGGATWERPIVNPGGYRSSVVFDGPELLIATGTSGTDISADGGSTWKRISSMGFNVAATLDGKGPVWLAGSGGRIAEWLQQAR